MKQPNSPPYKRIGAASYEAATITKYVRSPCSFWHLTHRLRPNTTELKCELSPSAQNVATFI
jgi:hypothetical protein